LGPILFLLYINDLANILNKLKFILFVDDTNVFYAGKSITEVNKLSLNINKTNYMCFHNESYQDYCKLKIDGLEVSRVQVTKFQGVLVDEKLSWFNHINAVCKNVLKNISNTCLKITTYTCYTVH